MLHELPPRTRRILATGSIRCSWVGTTSAHAENTLGILKDDQEIENYLRARGEYPATRANAPIMVELPPRTRRIHFPALFDTGFLGTTSAHAENSQSLVIDDIFIRNYLRARGEYWPMVTTGVL